MVARHRSGSVSEVPGGEPIVGRAGSVGAGRYLLQGRIGVGGVAEVFRAIDTVRQVDVAVKIMEDIQGLRPKIGARFLAEAKVMGALDHPNVVRVTDFGWEQGTYWTVMELVRGGTIAQRVHLRGPFDPAEALRLTFELLQALAAVHQAGLVHRDVKPQNVLLDDQDHVRLADFGIARHPDGSVPLHTRPGEQLGTRGFRAPEQEDDAHGVLPIADLYGVAATLYAMVVGTPPARLWREDGQSTVPEHVPPDLAALIRGGSTPDLAQRYPDARAMAVAVAEVADHWAWSRGQPKPSGPWLERFDRLLKPPARGLSRFVPAPVRTWWSTRWR